MDRCFIGLLISLALTTSAHAQTGFQVAWDRETALLVPKLDELAGWAQKQRLFAECVRTYQLIIELEPDHARGRRVLRYRREGKDGPWARSRPFKMPKNLSEKGLAEYRTRRATLVTPFVKSIVDALEEAHSAIDGKVREDVLRKLIRIDPENADARRAFGDVKSGDRWLPEDAVVAGVRRKELVRKAKQLRDAVPATRPAPLTPADEALGIAFRSSITTGDVRVLSTGDPAEAALIARCCHAAPSLFNALLNTTARLPEGYSVFVLPDDAAKKQLLDKHPDINADNRRFFEQLSGGWVRRSTHLLDWSPNSAGRIDYAVRQTHALMFIRDYGITMRQGWVWEGFGLYLTDLICGTKLTYYVRSSTYSPGADGLRRRLMNKATNWFSEGLALLRRPDHPALGGVLTADATGMSDEDMLLAYVVAAWLIETRPSKLRSILRSVAATDASGKPGVTGPTALREHLGIDLPTLERRLVRWLEAVVAETKPAGG